jgi:hypothetical protein
MTGRIMQCDGWKTRAYGPSRTGFGIVVLQCCCQRRSLQEVDFPTEYHRLLSTAASAQISHGSAPLSRTVWKFQLVCT